jgi:hypothetical protein
MNRLLRIDWDLIAGIVAAVAAIILHLLHIVHVDVLLTIVLVLLALLLLRDLRRESREERLGEAVDQLRGSLRDVQRSLQPPEAVLIGPRHLRTESRRFTQNAQGEMVWFNVCFLMFQSQETFDLLLRPAIENPHVTSIRFISDAGEQQLWEQNMQPRIRQCTGCEKVHPPQWRTLPQTISFILADTAPEGTTEALVSFWGEPFMARTTGSQVPRFIFHVHARSDLIGQLVELERRHRIDGSTREPA